VSYVAAIRAADFALMDVLADANDILETLASIREQRERGNAQRHWRLR